MLIKSLGFIALRLPDESPTSVIQRTMKSNGFRNYRGLIDAIKNSNSSGAIIPRLQANSSIADALIECAPFLSHQIRSSFYAPKHPLIKRSDVLISGVTVKLSFIRHRSTAFCSECFNSGYERYPKDLKLFNICPFHERRYLFACPACSKKLNWKCLPSDRCRCGNQLISPLAAPGESTSAHYLLKLFEEANAAQLELIQNQLTHLKKLLHADETTLSNTLLNLVIAISRSGNSEIAEAIWKVLPCQDTDEIGLSLSILSPYIPPKNREKIAHLLQSLSTAKKQGIIAAISIDQRMLLKYLKISYQTWESLLNANRQLRKLKCARYTPKQLIEIKQIFSTDHIEQRIRIVNHNKTWQNHLLTVAKTAELTDLPEECIFQMCSKTNIAGPLIESTHVPPHVVLGRNQIQQFNLTYICSQRLSAELNIPIETISRTIKNLDIEITQSRHIPGTMIIKQLDKELLISTIQKTERPRRRPRFIRGEHPFTGDRNPILLTIDECAELLHISQKSLLSAARGKILRCYAEKTKGQYLFLKSDVLDFRQRFASATEISKILNIPAGHVASFLRHNHIYEACPTSRTSKFYRLTDLLRKNLLPWMSLTRINSNKSLEQPFTFPISDLSEKFNIQKVILKRIFLSSKLLHYKTIKSEHYITPEDATLISDILKTHITYEDADKLYNLPKNHTRTLINNNRIHLDKFSNIMIRGLVSRAALTNYFNKI